MFEEAVTKQHRSVRQHMHTAHMGATHKRSDGETPSGLPRTATNE